MYELYVFQDMNHPERFLFVTPSKRLPETGALLVEDETGNLTVKSIWKLGCKMEGGETPYPERYTVLVEKVLTKSS